MWDIPAAVMQLIARIQQLPVGFMKEDYEDLAIILSRGFEPRAFGRLKGRTERRELAEMFFKKIFRAPPLMKGDITMGSNDNGVTCYDSKYSPMHLCGIGATGSGKTVFLVSLLECYLRVAMGIWLFDFCKRSLRGFLRIAAKSGRKAVVCRHECAFNNPLDPEDIDPAYYINICAEFLTISLNLPPVARHILKICLTKLYEEYGLLNDHRASPPLLTELLEAVRAFEGNKAAKDAIIIRLEAMLTNKRQIFSVRRGFQIKDLEQQVIIWEFDGLETEYQNLLAMQLVCKLFARRVKFVPQGLMVVALDEAARLYSKRAESVAEGPSFVDTMTSVVREKLISLKVMTQTAYGLSNSIIANSGIKVLFAAGSPHDYEIFGRSMGLSSEQIQWAKTNLTVSSQIIKMSFGYLQPFVNYTTDLKIPQDVTDEEVLQSVQPLLDQIHKSEIQSRPALLLPSSSAEENSQDMLTADEQALLDQVRQHPEITTATGHYRRLNTGTKRATAAKQALVSKGLIKETVLESGGRGKSSLYLEAADEKSHGRQGSNLHQYLQSKVAIYYSIRGSSDPELLGNRAYPLLMVAEGTGDGLTGGGTYAYNVTTNSSWDDTDGGSGGLDYSFVYDGTENQATNLALNPTRERLVPSIRWECLRAGIQDAQILLYLKAVESQQSPAVQAQIQAILAEDANMAYDVTQGPNQWDGSIVELNDAVIYSGWVTYDYVFNYAQQIRQLYASVNPNLCSYAIAGDLNKDCKVNFADFVTLASEWLSCNLSPPQLCGN